MVKDHSDSEGGNLLLPHGLLFPISSKGSFICIIPHTGWHIPQPLLHQSWITGWNETIEYEFHTLQLWLGISYAWNQGPGRSSEVERSLMVRWVVGSILHGVDPLSYFSFQPVLHDWCNKGHGMCYLVCGMVHIKEPMLLIDKSSLCGGSRFPFSLSEWSLTICLTPYNRR